MSAAESDYLAWRGLRYDPWQGVFQGAVFFFFLLLTLPSFNDIMKKAIFSQNMTNLISFST